MEGWLWETKMSTDDRNRRGKREAACTAQQIKLHSCHALFSVKQNEKNIKNLRNYNKLSFLRLSNGATACPSFRYGEILQKNVLVV